METVAESSQCTGAFFHPRRWECNRLEKNNWLKRQQHKLYPSHWKQFLTDRLANAHFIIKKNFIFKFFDANWMIFQKHLGNKAVNSLALTRRCWGNHVGSNASFDVIDVALKRVKQSIRCTVWSNENSVC